MPAASTTGAAKPNGSPTWAGDQSCLPSGVTACRKPSPEWARSVPSGATTIGPGTWLPITYSQSTWGDSPCTASATSRP